MFLFADYHLWMLGGFYLFAAFLVPVEQLYAMLHAGLVGTSPMRRTIDGNATDFIVATVTGVVYIVYIIVACIKENSGLEDCGKGIVVAAVLLAITVIYYSSASKKFMLSLILYVPVIFWLYVSSYLFMDMEFDLSLPAGIGIGAVVLSLSCILAHFLRRALYKEPVSVMHGASLLKAMK